MTEYRDTIFSLIPIQDINIIGMYADVPLAIGSFFWIIECKIGHDVITCRNIDLTDTCNLFKGMHGI